jgi:predicted SnoaL-like aldol condensation-catalyzing enzyme
MRSIRFALAGAIAAIALAGSGAAFAETAKETANKQTAIAFYNKAINDKDFDAAARFLGGRYTNHNPTATDGPEGLKAYIQFLRTSFPQQHNEIVRSFASGDFVILHVHSTRPGAKERAIVDMFKLENGKVVEHWDVIQEIPEKAANANTMF